MNANNLPPAYQKRDFYPVDINPLPRRDWENVRRFTPALYYEYETAPIWEIDSASWKDEAEYTRYWSTTVQDLLIASKAIIGKWQLNGKAAAKALETNQPASVPIFDFASAMAYEPLPIAISQVHEKVALLSSNPPRFAYQQQQESQIPFVAALNGMAEAVIDDCDYEKLVSDAYYAIQFWNACCFKWCVEMFEPGLFGQMGKISLDLPEMDTIFPDPKARVLDWRYMDYVVQQHKFEIGEIQQQYPLSAWAVTPDADELISDTSVQSRNNEDYIQSPQPKLARDAAGRRQKITVLECYIKDSRLKFEPEIKDESKTDFAERFKVDKDGYLIGGWVKRYPNGRLLVVTRDVVLKDVANPQPHGEAPYVWATGMPASVPWATGNAPRVMTVTRKINNIMGDMHKYFQSEIPRPMHRGQGAVLDPNLAQTVSNQPSDIIDLKSVDMLIRRQASDVPPGAFTFLNILHSTVDQTSGSSSVMRGQLEEGAQISAEAMAQLQQYASSRLALEVRFFNTAIKKLGRQLMWILRAVVKSNIQFQVSLPNGDTEDVNWKSDREVFESGDPTRINELRAKECYLVKIKAGTGVPGAQQAQQANAQSLYNDRAIDRQAYLDSIEYQGRQEIVKRMRQAELEDIETKALGKELGVSIGDTIKQDKPGRREKI